MVKVDVLITSGPFLGKYQTFIVINTICGKQVWSARPHYHIEIIYMCAEKQSFIDLY